MTSRAVMQWRQINDIEDRAEQAVEGAFNTTSIAPTFCGQRLEGAYFVSAAQCVNTVPVRSRTSAATSSPIEMG